MDVNGEICEEAIENNSCSWYRRLAHWHQCRWILATSEQARQRWWWIGWIGRIRPKNNLEGFLSHGGSPKPLVSILPSGKLTKSYWKWPFIVDFPIQNGGSFHSFLYVYQRVTWSNPNIIRMICWWIEHVHRSSGKAKTNIPTKLANVGKTTINQSPNSPFL